MAGAAGRLVKALLGMREPQDRVVTARVAGFRGEGRYAVSYGDQEWVIPALGGVRAQVNQRVAVVVSGRSKQPVALIGPLQGA